MRAAAPDRWLFDVWSHVYDAALVQRLTYRPIHDAVLRALGLAPPRRLLDVGSGTGLLTSRIRAAHPEAQIVGCDFSRGMVRRAASRERAAHWLQGDAMRLPFRTASFDAVVSTESFHWFPDPATALAELYRVLVPGGRVLIAFVNPRFATIGRAAGLLSRLAGEPLHWPTRERMAARVEAAGFRLESQHRVLRLPGAILLPPVLTVAVRPRAEPAPASDGGAP